MTTNDCLIMDLFCKEQLHTQTSIKVTKMDHLNVTVSEQATRKIKVHVERSKIFSKKIPKLYLVTTSSQHSIGLHS